MSLLKEARKSNHPQISLQKEQFPLAIHSERLVQLWFKVAPTSFKKLYRLTLQHCITVKHHEASMLCMMVLRVKQQLSLHKILLKASLSAKFLSW